MAGFWRSFICKGDVCLYMFFVAFSYSYEFYTVIKLTNIRVDLKEGTMGQFPSLLFHLSSLEMSTGAQDYTPAYKQGVNFIFN